MSGDLHAQNQHDAAKEAQPILQPENLHDRAADPAEKTKADTSGDWQPQDLHDRAAAAAKETRSTIIKLTTASVGGLFVIATKEFKAGLEWKEQLAVLSTLFCMVLSLAAAIWFGFSEAAVELLSRSAYSA
jgi:hypothetical protein